MKSAAIRKAAKKAAEAIGMKPPPPEAVLSREHVWDAGGFPHLPEASTSDQFKAWQLAQLSYIEHIRTLLMLAPVGRYLDVVRGRGFALLSPGDSVAYAMDSTLRKIDAATKRGAYIARNAAVTSAEDVAAQTDAQMRIGALRGALTSLRRRTERDKRVVRARQDDPQDLASVLGLGG